MSDRKDTRVHLVADIEGVLPHVGATKRRKLEAIIEKARAGEFHDYKSPHVCGKVYLVSLLRDADMNVLAQRVMDGEYDEEADAEDRADMANDLRDAPELRRALNLPDPGKA